MSNFHFNICILTDFLPPVTTSILFLDVFLPITRLKSATLLFQACFIKPSITDEALIQACPLEGSKYTFVLRCHKIIFGLID